MKTKRKAIALISIGVIVGYLALASVANAAPTTTIPTCNRADVNITTPIVVANGKASVSFTLQHGCSFDVGLATYESPGPKYDPATVQDEIPLDHTESHFTDDGIVHTLSVTAPNCFYQVDFFLWRYIPHFTTTNQYLGDLIAPQNAGTVACGPGVTTTTTAPVTTTTVEAPGASTPPDTDALTGAVATPTLASVGSDGATLPFTGIHLKPVIIAGITLIIIGLLLVASSSIWPREAADSEPERESLSV